MKKLNRNDIDQLKIKLEPLKDSINLELIDVFRNAKNFKLIDESKNETNFENVIPIELVFGESAHATNEEMGYLEYRIKLMSSTEILERTLLRVGYSLKDSWVSSPYGFNIPLTDLKTKLKFKKLLESLSKDVDKTIKTFIN
ncbi:MAG TPA: hypothetical protein PLP33_23645 [Leptospiraceae bacterium]|nr:hypothetical protein [Leptospiraceae bacterium]